MERSFKKEIGQLRLGSGETFSGEGILAVTKALLQSGVSYIGGYQGSPISQLLDVMVDASDLLEELGVHLETPTGEAAAAAMLAASINYPMRGAVTWKSVVGTNVASDALSNVASAGVMGGALIVIGEDYGEGASIIQERSHAFAMKSSMCLLDPRPNLTSIVESVEKGFELSEASNMPVMLQLRIRACHVTGNFVAKKNREPMISRKQVLQNPTFDIDKFCLPPSTYLQEKKKVESRIPAAVEFIVQNKVNETFGPDSCDIGIITLGGHYNGVVRSLERLGLADIYGNTQIPMYVMNVAYPVIQEEIRDFCAGKQSVLVVEEGFPEYIEQAVHVALRQGGQSTQVLGKEMLLKTGEYTADVMQRGIEKFLELVAPKILHNVKGPLVTVQLDKLTGRAVQLLGEVLPPRPPSFCTGCPERPVFSAMKIVEKEVGPTHVSADIGCHTFAVLPPFNIGNTVVGYGLGLASSAGIAPNFGKKVISIMGDGGFWHNGLSSGVASANFNRDDSVLIIMQNGYASATGWQFLPSSQSSRFGLGRGMSIENALKGLGIKWIKKVKTYDVASMARTLRRAMTDTKKGLKVIIADGECQLARQRRIRPQIRRQLESGKRVVKTKFGIDDDLCTGDHSCIRMSGCPSLTIKPNPSPLRRDPVAHVNNGCVGCGLCGEVAHAAVLCPSFYKADTIQNPTKWDLWLERWRRSVIGLLQDLARA
jgi:indolepyruvate ferredoxin oxidoreductase alpha subunit